VIIIEGDLLVLQEAVFREEDGGNRNNRRALGR